MRDRATYRKNIKKHPRNRSKKYFGGTQTEEDFIKIQDLIIKQKPYTKQAAIQRAIQILERPGVPTAAPRLESHFQTGCGFHRDDEGDWP